MENIDIGIIDVESLKTLNKILESKKEYIINYWLDDEKLKPIFEILEIEKETFKSKYAYHIFHHFQSIDYDNMYFKTYIDEMEDKQHLIKYFYRLIAHLKNKIILFLIQYNIDNNDKIFMDDSLLYTIDNAISELLDSITKHLQRDYTANTKKLKILENAALVTRTDKDGSILFMSPPLLELLGYSEEEMLGAGFNKIRHPRVSSKFYEKLWRTLKSGKPFKGTIKNLTKNRKEVIFHTQIVPDFNFDGEIVGYTAIKTDLTDKTRARTDTLTGLLNRSAFNDRLSELIDRYNNFHIPVSLIMIDIDYFSEVNNNYGHITGDKTLKHFVKLIKEIIRPTDTFARWGGEEFIIIQNNTLDNSIKTAERIRKHIAESTFPEVGQKTCSLGVAEFNNSYADIDSFINELDKALYYSKEHGRNKVSYVVKNGIESV